MTLVSGLPDFLLYLGTATGLIDAVIAMVRKVVESDERVRKDPAPIVVVSRFTDAAVMVMVEAWVANPDLGPVPCTANELEQVLLNLLKNAAQAIHQRPQPSEPGRSM